MEQHLIQHFYTEWESPIGAIKLISNSNSLVFLGFNNQTIEKDFPNLDPSPNPILKKTISQLKEYFDGKRTNFTIPIQLLGTTFQQQVWENLQQVPYGSYLTYSELAKQLGDENKIRAVANANSRNNILIIIPCHRIIGEKNRLVGYRGGLDRKRWLLSFEAEHSDHKKQELLF